MLPVMSDGITKSRLLQDFRTMGIAPGDHLSLGMSFKSIGRVDGGPEMFLDALLEAVGPDGTIMVNAFTRVSGLSKLETGQDDYVFDYLSTPANTGIIAETLRRRRGALRSRHPTDSVAAIGRLAPYLTCGHDHRSAAFTPNFKLAEVGGKILSIGIGDKLAGFLHGAQDLAGLLNVVPWKLGARFVDETGAVRIFIAEDTAGCTTRLFDIVTAIRKMGIIAEGKVGKARSIVAPAKESLEKATQMLKQNPVLNLCDDFTCLWCRELERRLDLYSDIEDRRWFQSNPLAIALVATANWFRLGGNPLVTRLRRLANILGPGTYPLRRHVK